MDIEASATSCGLFIIPMNRRLIATVVGIVKIIPRHRNDTLSAIRVCKAIKMPPTTNEMIS